LPTAVRPVEILEHTKGMPERLLRRAVRVVEANALKFRKEWDILHGTDKKTK
jgi:hypothetical protein